MQMQNMNQNGNQMATNMPMKQSMSNNHGGHELFDAHEVISGIICMLDQYLIYDQHIKDPELKTILQRQSAFVTQTYNTIVESFKTGQDPTIPTQQYEMTQNNDVIYGLKPGQPKKPMTSLNEISDQGISGFMLGQAKSMSSMLAMAALEMTNPVLRRVIADSVPNFIELSYEIFLYQNKHGYYQVPQLMQQDMNQMLTSYTQSNPQQPGSMTN
ncbi:spore coat protein [Mesobacillus selenatarsenatis]|uniref:CDS_ID OB3198 n=1 Tax=Mesobacillus selenatarsenatis (strain DSM 18680 / JCM 14380 / FERM P-15431 / SF-1) TaxID=1321606 RepID=A0A0A8X8N9_MESS1|nr:spore coat protein [Mesobacillus selenatarsenatis]GAM15659.1 CDS_ID OB3198 [Mesobacillus selenatarsenatis SF-1]